MHKWYRIWENYEILKKNNISTTSQFLDHEKKVKIRIFLFISTDNFHPHKVILILFSQFLR